MTEVSNGVRVFVSYARADGSEFVKDLVPALEAAGFDPFLDKQDIKAGTQWLGSIHESLLGSDSVIFVLTQAFLTSQACADEVAKAEELRKRVLPVIISAVPTEQIPETLRKYNYVFFNQGPFGEKFKELCAGLRTNLDYDRLHTSLGSRATHWRTRTDGGEDLLLRGQELGDAKAWLASWRPPNPEPTDTHRAFINASDAAEGYRNSEERKRLARDRRRTLVFLAVGALLFVGALVSFLGMLNARANAQSAIEAAEIAKKEAAAAKEEAAAAKQQAADAQAAAEAQTKVAEESKKSLAQATTEAIVLNDAAAGGDGLRRRSPSDYSNLQATLRKARIAAGWDVDVFYCAGKNGAQNKSRAEAIVNVLEAEQTRQLQSASGQAAGLAFALGRLRPRELRAEANARPGYQITGDVIRAEPKEDREADALRALLGRSGYTLGPDRSGMPTPFYLSIFLCSGS